ncbi:PLC-like phosphodiesterase [Nemania abortiva]|nr:PLC-like phosphodiesterase [Nemania abortiva]
MASRKTLGKGEGRPDKVLLTDANVTVFNDCPKPITVRAENNEHMTVTLPSSIPISSGGSFTSGVRAGGLLQSSFVVHFPTGDKMKIDIGTGLFKTSATPEYFANGKSAALLAPTKPFGTGTDYYFWFFNGPGVLSPLINSAIQANLPAILSYLAQNPQTFHITDGISITIKGLKIDPAQVQCVYSACLPKAGPQGGNWNVNTLLHIGSGALTASVTIKCHTGDLYLSVKDLMVYVQAQISLTYDTELHAKVLLTALQCSLGNYDISGTIVEILISLFPTFAELVGSPYHMAGFINTTFNEAIINFINSKLSPPKPRSVFSITSRLSFVSPVLSVPPPIRLELPSFSAGFNTANWMSDPKIQDKILAELKLPGTHDSATYDLSSVLSQVVYSEIQRLWYLSDGSAPINGKWPISIPPTDKDPDYLGKTLYKYVMGTGVNSISRTQGLTIDQQLQAGIRHFDLRVYYDDRDKMFYTQHALRGPSLQDILSQIANFFKLRPTSGELVFVVISHTNLNAHPDQIPKLIDWIKKYLRPENIYHPSSEKNFFFQSLAVTRLRDITKGAPKVMFINADWNSCYYPDIVTNTPGYAGTEWDGDKHTPDELAMREGPSLLHHCEPLWSVSWSLAADIPTIIQANLELLTGAEKWALRDLAIVANKALRGFLGGYGGASARFNVATVDWPECGDSESVPEMIIRMNYENGEER